MYKAKNILLFTNIECVPFILSTNEDSWNFTERVTELATHLLIKNHKNVYSYVPCIPTDKLPIEKKMVTPSFIAMWRENIKKLLLDKSNKIEAIAIITGLKKCSEKQDWLEKFCNSNFIIYDSLPSFIDSGDSAVIETETTKLRTYYTFKSKDDGFVFTNGKSRGEMGARTK